MRIFFLVSLLTFSCVRDRVQKTFSQLDLQDWELEIYDSIRFEFNAENIRLVDQSNDNLFLGFNRRRGVISLFDPSGRRLISFPQTSFKVGEGLTRGAGFMNDTTILLFGSYGYATYNLEGDLINTSEFDGKNIIAQINQWRAISYSGQEGDPLMLIPGGDQVIETSSRESYASFPFVTHYEPETGQFRCGVFFPEGSPYLEGIIPILGPLFDQKAEQLFVVFPHDKRLLTYNLKDLDRPSSITPLFPSKFKAPITIPFNRPKLQRSPKAQEYNLLNSRYINLYALDDGHILLCYEAGFNEEDVKAKVTELELVDKKRYLQVIKNGRQLSKDIAMPASYYAPYVAKDLDRIIFSTNYKHRDEKSLFQTFYLGRVKPAD